MSLYVSSLGTNVDSNSPVLKEGENTPYELRVETFALDWLAKYLTTERREYAGQYDPADGLTLKREPFCYTVKGKNIEFKLSFSELVKIAEKVKHFSCIR